MSPKEPLRLLVQDFLTGRIPFCDPTTSVKSLTEKSALIIMIASCSYNLGILSKTESRAQSFLLTPNSKIFHPQSLSNCMTDLQPVDLGIAAQHAPIADRVCAPLFADDTKFGNLKARATDDRYRNKPEPARMYVGEVSQYAPPPSARFMRFRRWGATRAELRGSEGARRPVWWGYWTCPWLRPRQKPRQCCRRLLQLLPWQRWRRMTSSGRCEAWAVVRRLLTARLAPGTHWPLVSSKHTSHANLQ